MYGTFFIFKRTGSNRKISARLDLTRTELWIDKNPIAKYSEPVWLFQRHQFSQPEVVHGEVDTAMEMAKIFDARGLFRVSAKEFAEALAASCPREYADVVVYLQRKRHCVMELNLLDDLEQIRDDIRKQLDIVKEESNVRKKIHKAKVKHPRRANPRSKRDA